ncbi:MAG: hypothetical protein AAB011_14045 [Candidatus Eisenbacteria bacterium]
MKRNYLRSALPYFGAGLLTFVLVLPGFAYPYLFDDFDFLVRSLHFSPALLLPDPSVIFYRPVSRELYFTLLQVLSPGGPLLGHALNALSLIISSLLIVQIGTHFAGRREGALAGLYFAAFGQIPLLVAWVSGVQDALAIMFTLVAISSECRRRHLLALIAAALAVLCKETAVALLPALALTNILFRKGPGESRWRAFDYLILGVFWGAVHPGINHVASRELNGSGEEYLGLGSSRWAAGLFRYLPLLANLPSPGLAVTWPPGLTGIAVVAVVGGVVATRYLPISGRNEGEVRPPRAPFIAIASLLMLLPLAASSALVRNWAPYYMAFAAIGVALLLAMLTARFPVRVLLVLVPLYVVSGVHVRGMSVEPGVTTEQSLAPAASALLRLEPQFRALAPTMRPGSQVLVANQYQGGASVHTHLYVAPMLQQWYRDSSIRVVRPELRATGFPAEYLFWLNRELNLFQVDLSTLQPRSVSKQASYGEYQGVLRAYSRGLVESGDLDGGVRLLLGMPVRSETIRWVDRRVAASYLFAFNRVEEGRELIRGAPSLSPTAATEIVTELLSQPTRTPRYDSGSFLAFDLDYDEPDAVRGVMHRLAVNQIQAAPRLALRLLTLRPGDMDAQSVIRDYAPGGPIDRLTPDWSAAPLPLSTAP